MGGRPSPFADEPSARSVVHSVRRPRPVYRSRTWYWISAAGTGSRRWLRWRAAPMSRRSIPTRRLCVSCWLRTPPQQFPRLQVRVGASAGAELSSTRTSAPCMSRACCTLWTATALRRSFANFFRWLYPEGKLYISALAPVGPFWSPFRRRLSAATGSTRSVAGLHRIGRGLFPEWGDEARPPAR